MAQPEPTNEWVSFYSDGGLMINGDVAPPGMVIRAYDPDGVLCGLDTTEVAGSYGLMPVYRDDATTEQVDEGADPGDQLTFTINGYPANPTNMDSPTWTSNGDRFELNLEAKTNQPPEVLASIGDIQIDVTDPARTINLDNFFSDPDGDPLTYMAKAEIPSVATPEVDRDTLLVEARSVGTTTMMVRAQDDMGASAYTSFSVTVTDYPPLPPQNLQLSRDGEGIQVQWSTSNNPAEDLKGYKLYRSTQPGFSISVQSLLTDTLTVSPFLDKSVDGQQYFYYRIAAYDTAGNESKPTSEVSIYFDNTPPAVPQGLTSTRYEDGITVNWESVTGDDFSAYRLYRGSDPGFTTNKKTLIKSGLQQAQFNDTLGTVQGSFFYKVTSLDTTGNQSLPSEVLAVKYDNNPPPAPGGLQGVATDNGILLKWLPVNTGDLDHYAIYEMPEPGASLKQGTQLANTQDTSYTDVTKTGTKYYTVTAIDTAGNTSLPATSIRVSFDLNPPAIPKGLKATAVDTGIVLQWEEVPATDLLEYHIYRGKKDNLKKTADYLLAEALQDTFYIDNPGPQEARYYYGISSVDTAGNASELSQIVDIYFDNLPPETPDITSVEWNESGLQVNWTPVQEGDLHSYSLYRTTATSSGMAKDTLLVDSLSTTSFLDETVGEGQTYYYSIASIDTLGNESSLSERVGKLFINEWSKSYEPGWQLISIPMSAKDSTIQALFPGADPKALYSYDGSYRPDSVITTGTGYWLRIDQQTEVNIEGKPLENIMVPLRAGWNLIGAPIDTVRGLVAIEDPNKIIIDGTFQYFTGAYQTAVQLTPGIGYYVRATEPGTIIIGNKNKPKRLEKSGTGAITANEVIGNFDQLTFGTGKVSQKLFINGELSGGWKKQNFSMPPVPPRPILDVRFDGDYRLCEQDSVHINLKAEEFPVSVELETNQYAQSYQLKLFRKGEKTEFLTLDNKKVSYIDNPVDYMTISPMTATPQQVPDQVELKPSYPNPFNPSTTIRYAIPKAYKVTLEVYDLLGQKVATLVDKQQAAGSYKIPFNASDLSSGLYFIQIRAGSYQEVQKITLVK